MAKNEENCGPTKNSNRQARLANENGLSVPTIPLQASTYPIATFDDYIVESSRRFDIEKNEKNMLYAFIDLLGLSEQYEEFRKEFSDFNPHELCLIILGLDRSCRSADSYLDCATLPMFLKSNN